MTDTSASSFPTADGKSDATSGIADGSTLRVASWNVFSSKVMGNGPDNHGFRRSLISLQCDVLGLQEVDRGMYRTHRRNLAEDAAFSLGGGHFFANARRRMDGGYYGNTVVTGKNVTLADARVLKLPRQGWRAERRVAAVTTIEKGTQRWTFATAHLSNTRSESQAQLMYLLKTLDEMDQPCVITGDFNRRPHEVLELVDSAGWSVAETGPTYPSGEPLQRIDYVLYKGCRNGGADVRSLAVSDHCAITADFTTG